MAKRSGARADVNLFPFLSVLCAMIGVLVLFLLIVVATRVHRAVAGTTDVRNLPPPPPPPQRKLETGQGLEPEEYERVRGQIEQLTTRLAERARQHDDVQRKIVELAELIASRQDAAALNTDDAGDYVDGIALNPREDVIMVEARNGGLKQKPHFLEVTADAYILHPEQTRFPVSDIERDKSPFDKFLASINKKSEYLLLLVHPNGAGAFAQLRSRLIDRFPDPSSPTGSQISLGWEPFTPGWVLISKELNNGASAAPSRGAP